MKKVIQNEVSVSTLKDKEVSEVFNLSEKDTVLKDYTLEGEYKVGTLVLYFSKAFLVSFHKLFSYNFVSLLRHHT